MKYTDDEIQWIVRKILSDQKRIPIEEIPLEAHFYYDLVMDSLDSVEVIMALEETLGLEIPDEEVENIIFEEPGMLWTIFRTITNLRMRRWLDVFGFSSSIFRREVEIETFANDNHVLPFSVGLFCVCLKRFLSTVDNKIVD